MFGDKPKSLMQINSDPLQVNEAHFIKHVEIMMIQISIGLSVKVK